MKNIGTKKVVFLSSVIGLVLAYILVNPVFFHICMNTYTFGSHVGCLDEFPELTGAFLIGISLPLFLLSLLTYKMREEAFRAWWSLARWMVPIIAVATLLIQLVPKNGGFFNMDALIYLLVLAPLYAIFILGSLWKIFRAYRGK